jgi:glycoprotein 2-beta-D-xylosyltransferase
MIRKNAMNIGRKSWWWSAGCITRMVIALWVFAMLFSMIFLLSYNSDTTPEANGLGNVRTPRQAISTSERVVQEPFKNERNEVYPHREENVMPGMKHNNKNWSPSDSHASRLYNWAAENPPYIPKQPQDPVPALDKGISSSDFKSDEFGLNDRSYGMDCEHFDHSILRPTHGCQINKHTYMVFCNFENLKIDVSKITSDSGGEPLSSVMGRAESKELPRYEKGAFTTPKLPSFNVPDRYRMNLHYVKDVLNSLVYPTKKNQGKTDMTCTETWQGTTMFITRYEYVNLFHTMTDWFNTFLSLPPEDDHVRVVFLDAHAEGNLDSVWNDVFAKFTYVQRLPEGGVCFEKAIFIPPGYVSPIYQTLVQSFDISDERENCPHHDRAMEFSNLFARSYNLETDDEPVWGKVIIIDRQHYVAHPRSKPGKTPRMLSNLKELKKALRGVPGVTSVSMVRFETMTFREQLQTIRQAHIVIGNHGAGLSHVMFMNEKSTLIEFSTGGADYFDFMAQWKGVSYHAVPIDYDDTSLQKKSILEVFQFVKSKMSISSA